MGGGECVHSKNVLAGKSCMCDFLYSSELKSVSKVKKLTSIYTRMPKYTTEELSSYVKAEVHMNGSEI